MASLSREDVMRRARIAREHDNDACDCAEAGAPTPGDAELYCMLTSSRIPTFLPLPPALVLTVVCTGASRARGRLTGTALVLRARGRLLQSRIQARSGRTRVGYALNGWCESASTAPSPGQRRVPDPAAREMPDHCDGGRRLGMAVVYVAEGNGERRRVK